MIRVSDLAGAIIVAVLLTACNDGSHQNDGASPFASKETDPLKIHNCRVVKWEETGERRYCGKACWRHIIRKTYACDDYPRSIEE